MDKGVELVWEGLLPQLLTLDESPEVIPPVVHSDSLAIVVVVYRPTESPEQQFAAYRLESVAQLDYWDRLSEPPSVCVLYFTVLKPEADALTRRSA